MGDAAGIALAAAAWVRMRVTEARPTLAIFLALMSVGVVLVLISSDAPGTTILEAEASQPLMSVEQDTQAQQLLSLLSRQASPGSVASSTVGAQTTSAEQAAELQRAMSQEATRRQEMLKWRALSQQFAGSSKRPALPRPRRGFPASAAPMSPELQAIAQAGAMLRGAESSVHQQHEYQAGASHSSARTVALHQAVRDETKQRLKVADIRVERDDVKHALRKEKAALEAEKAAHQQEHRRFLRLQAKLALTKKQATAKLKRAKKQAHDAVLSVQQHALKATKVAVAAVKRRAVQLASAAAHDEAKQLITEVAAPVAPAAQLSETSLKMGITQDAPGDKPSPVLLRSHEAGVMQSATEAKALQIAKHALEKAQLAELGQAKTEQRLQHALKQEKSLEMELKQQKANAEQLEAHAQHVGANLRADFQQRSVQAKAPEQQRLEAQVQRLRMERDMAREKLRAMQVAGGKSPATPMKSSDPKLEAAQVAVHAAKRAMAKAGAMARAAKSRAQVARTEAVEALSTE